MPSRRKQSKLLLAGYAYAHRNVLKDGRHAWRCDATGCGVKCFSNLSDGVHSVESPPQHSHLANPDKIAAEQVRAAVRKECLTQPRSSVVQIIADTLAVNADTPLQVVPAKMNLKRTAWIARSSDQSKRLKIDPAHPPNYDSLAALVLPEALKVLGEEAFLLLDTGAAKGDKRMLLFATATTIEFLRKCPLWLVDGTFRKAPQLFYQLYTIYAFELGHTVPCIFAMLPNKTAATYNTMWNAIDDEVGISDMPEKPTVLLDYEQAAIKAAAAKVGDENLGGCYFHFSQARYQVSQDDVSWGVALRLCVCPPPHPYHQPTPPHPSMKRME